MASTTASASPTPTATSPTPASVPASPPTSATGPAASSSPAAAPSAPSSAPSPVPCAGKPPLPPGKTPGLSPGPSPVPPVTPGTPAKAPSRGSISTASSKSDTKSIKKDMEEMDKTLKLPSVFFRPALVDLCIKVLAKYFLDYPIWGLLPADLRSQVVALLSEDLPLELCAQAVVEEEFWERKASKQGWKLIDRSPHGGSWKQLYFELTVAEALESYDPTITGEKTLRKLLELSAPFVHNVDLVQIPSHLSLSIITECLAKSLVSLKLEYGRPNVGFHGYDAFHLGMKISDCHSLAAALADAPCLAELNLSSNLLDDEKVKLICKGLTMNPTIINLDLAHNKFSDAGVADIIKLLAAENTVLSIVNLCNNRITAVGAAAMAEQLATNKVLRSLNLRLNNIGDEGGLAIFEALQSNTTLERLSLGACGVGEQSAASYGRLLKNLESGLLFVDLSSNRKIGADGGLAIKTGLEGGKAVKQLDLQLCDCGKELEDAIQNLVINFHYPEIIVKKAIVEEVVAPPPPEPEVKKKSSEDGSDESDEEETPAAAPAGAPAAG